MGLSDAGWVNPLEDIGKFGNAFDDVRKGLDGSLWIAEYKGGTAGLEGGQMSREWVEGVLVRMKAMAPGHPWIEPIENALRSGQLKGVAVRTGYSEAGTETTKVIKKWDY